MRRHQREPLATRVRVSWTPPGGATQYMICNSVDISESGLRIMGKERLTVGQYVHIQVDAYNLRGQASVRSCTHMKMNNEIGLEFSNGLRWRPNPAPAA